MWQTFFLSLPVFLLIGVGVLLVRLGRTSEAGEAMALRLVIEFFLPCFILRNVLGVEGIDDPVRLVQLLGAGFLLMLGQLWLTYAAARFLGLQEGEGKRTFAVSTGMPNYGFLPIPLVQSLFGPGAVLASLLVHNVGLELAVWTVAVSFYGGRFSWKQLLNPPLFALALALVLNFSGLGARLPDWVESFLELAGAAAIPLGIVVVGMAIGDPKAGLRFSDFTRRWKVILGSVMLRLGLLPLLLLGLALAVRDLGFAELAAVMGVHAAMPAATMPVVLARHFGGHPPTAVQVCVLTTAVSLFTTPLWLALAGNWLGW